jgi:hypothetical protein
VAIMHQRLVEYGQRPSRTPTPSREATLIFSMNYKRGMLWRCSCLLRNPIEAGGLTMGSNQGKAFRKAAYYVGLGTLVTSVALFGQEPASIPPPADTSPGWHHFSSPPPPPSSPQPDQTQADPRQTAAPQGDPLGPAVPESITIPAGTFITVRIDQFLSSDKNRAGDGFSATLSRPLVTDGLVIARRGQTVGGQVTEAQKAGRVKGLSRLAVQLTMLTLADGQQVPIMTGLDNLRGSTSNGRDAAAMAGTTGTGAAIGAAAGGGVGAGIGAGAGLLASTIGVLVTRGHPTVIYPESQLTFRLAKAVTFSTVRAPQAFVGANAADYDQPSRVRGRAPMYRSSCGYGGCPPTPPYYYYPPPYYPYYWGPTFSFWYGPRFHGWYGRGYGFRR